MRAQKWLFTACLVLGMFFIGCSDDDDGGGNGDDSNLKNKTILNSTAFDQWVYFSFEQGKEVTVTDPQDDLSWDIAFHVGDIKLNGGKSGKGAGGAIAITDEALKTAPESGYATDETADILLGMPPSYEKDGSKNKILSAWLKKEGMGYTPTENNLFVVKTASEKYMKIKFTSYAVNANGSMGMAGQGEVPGIFTFEYYCQADGSRDF